LSELEFRAGVLAAIGANATETEELLAYNRSVFERDNFKAPLQFPLQSEPHVAVWQEYVTEAKTKGTFEILKHALVQLRFPIQEGISQTEAYRAATRKGLSPDSGGLTVGGNLRLTPSEFTSGCGMQSPSEVPELNSGTRGDACTPRKGIEPNQTTGLVLQQPEQLQLTIHDSLAGAIPVLLTKNREDFVSLVRAITKRNEPVEIPDSMGACMVAGYNNWDRIRRYREGLSPEFNSGTRGDVCTPRQQWSADNLDSSELSWSVEFKRLIARKELYQDRFIILSDGFYSNVKPEELGLTAAEWRRLSLTIRLEHECTHYFTRRVFNSMRNNLLDEFIADYRGIVAATGAYKADWFLRFLGLESFPHYREGGRLQNYRGQPPLSDGAFKTLQKLVKVAAENLEDFERNYAERLRTIKNQTLMLMALTYLTIEELASSQASNLIKQAIEQLQSQTLSQVALLEET
jgi:hypothetical protein